MQPLPGMELQFLGILQRGMVLQNGPEMNIKTLTSKLMAIHNLGWIRSTRRGPTGIGHTLEGLLGYSENNLAIADWGDLEIKTTRKDQRSLVTLFSKSPKRVEGMKLAEFIREYGYWDESRERQALYCTVTALEENTQGWILAVNSEEGLVEFHHTDKKAAYHNLDSLQDAIEGKIRNLALIMATCRTEGKSEFFYYDEAYLLAGASLDGFLKLLQEGGIVFDWRMHLKSNGRARDHGPAYRIYSDKLPILYKKVSRLL